MMAVIVAVVIQGKRLWELMVMAGVFVVLVALLVALLAVVVVV